MIIMFIIGCVHDDTSYVCMDWEDPVCTWAMEMCCSLDDTCYMVSDDGEIVTEEEYVSMCRT